MCGGLRNCGEKLHLPAFTFALFIVYVFVSRFNRCHSCSLTSLPPNDFKTHKTQMKRATLKETTTTVKLSPTQRNH